MTSAAEYRAAELCHACRRPVSARACADVGHRAAFAAWWERGPGIQPSKRRGVEGAVR